MMNGQVEKQGGSSVPVPATPAAEGGNSGGQQKVKDQAQAAAKNTQRAATEAAQDIGEQATQAAREAGDRLQQTGAALVDQQKNRAAEELSHLGSALHRAAETLRDEQDENLAHYTEAAAKRIDGVSENLRNKGIGELAGDVEHMTRRRPELVLGGLFVAGMGIARFLKASGDRQPSSSRRNELARQA